jgi:hypothetical protein
MDFHEGSAMQTRTTMVAATLAVGMTLGMTGSAWAAPTAPGRASAPPAAAAGIDLPEGWAITGDAARPALTWTAPGTLPMGDARVEFFAGDRLLGSPRPAADHRSFRLRLGAVTASELADLQVRAGGRRVDAAGASARRAAARSATAAPAPATPQAIAAALPPNPVDPGVKGTFATVTGEYTLPGVTLPGFPQKVEMQAVVVAPKGTTGARPLALFLHGRHYTCFAGADEDKISGAWPCPAGTASIPSHRGYLQAQELLASQGYVTVSISANGINGQDWAAGDGGAQARSSLVRLHLGHWADWAGAQRASAPPIVQTAPPADLTRVLLMGHSRGGEGVNRAAIDSLAAPPAAQDGYHGKTRWTIRGTVLIGPTIFGHNPAPDVPSVTILPGCDGDVSDLQGQIFIDGTRGVSRGAALHSAVYVVGANHNFFNTEWTPGQAVAPASDDFGSEEPDKVCTPGTAKTRLTATQQQTVGATYLATAARLFVAGDDRVRPLLDGSGFRAPSAGPARVLTHAVGGARTPLVVPSSSTKVTGASARLCEQVGAVKKTACTDPESSNERSPHFVGFTYPEPGRYSVLMSWSTAGRIVSVKPTKPATVKGATALSLRIVVPPNTTGSRFAVAITDSKGRRAKLGAVRVDGLPGSPVTTSHWGQEVRVPLTAAVKAKLDLTRIAKLDLVPATAKGKAWLIDAWGWKAGTPAARPAALPRVDVGSLTVKEGDSGTRTVQVPVTVTGRGTAQVRLFLTDATTGRRTVTIAKVTPATRAIKIPITVTGNTRYGFDLQHSLQAKTITGAVIGAVDGGVFVTDDDPMPTVTVAPVKSTVAEGGTLTWKVGTSAKADAGIYVLGAVQAPATGTELSTVDVDKAWLEDWTGEQPLPARSLSSTEMSLFAVVEPGTTSTLLTIPTIKDTVVETDEVVQFQAMIMPRDFGEPIPGPVVTGTVTDVP